MSTYITREQTKLFKELGVIFAFTREQLEEQAEKDIHYVPGTGCGDFVPEDKKDEYFQRLESIHKTGRELEIANKGIDRIIEEALANQEAFWTGCIDSTYDELIGFGYEVNREQVQEVFDKCSKSF